MNRFAPLQKRLSGHDTTFLAGVPYVFHCHHFNLFHDQTIDDVLGEEEGFRLRARVARDVFGGLLRRLCEHFDVQTPAEKAELAAELFAQMGQGRLPVVLHPGGGAEVRSATLHYGYTWHAKYGERVRHLDPVDAVAAGMLAAVAECAEGRGEGGRRFRGVERRCLAQRHPECELQTEPEPEGGVLERLPLVCEEELLGWQGSRSRDGLDEGSIARWAEALHAAACGLEPNEDGLLPVFNVFVTQHLAGYYNETGFAAVRRLEAIHPSVAGAAESLLREAGHVCVFNTFGNILLSDLWPQVAEPLSGDPQQVVRAGCAIARALGFGRWSLQEYEPGKRLVVHTHTNYEAPYWLARFGPDTRSRSYFMQGAVQAFMVLAERVPWTERPTLDQAFYDSLFRGEGGLGVRVEVPECLTKGDAMTTVVVEAL